MKQDKLISIIVPIYNAEEFLSKCLVSILGQTYTEIEIILIDDGSPDNSGNICDEYADKDERIKVYHTQNGGVAKARQLGVGLSNGEYIVFVDPDDWLPLDSIEILYSNITPEIDIVVGSFYYCSQTSNIKSHDVIHNEEILTGENALKNALLYQNLKYGSPWAKLYRKKIFTTISFPNLKRCQDWLMNIELYSKTRKLKIISKSVYYYVSTYKGMTFISPVDLEYRKNFSHLLYHILCDNGFVDKCKEEYKLARFYYLYEAIRHNSEFVSNKDNWVKEVLKSVKYCRLPIKYKITYLMIKFKYLQLLMPIFRRIWRIIKPSSVRTYN